jgi:two-component system sensor histidine kinase and response regulator WspE
MSRAKASPVCASGRLPVNALEEMNAETAKTKTIIFVEDNPVVLAVYRMRLQQQGFHVVPAHDGLEAIKILSQFVPDLVVLDLMLPKFNGVEVLKLISADPRYQTVPVIILSTNSIIDAAEEYILERASKRLLKSSCTPAIMLQTVREVLGDPSVQNGASPANPADDSQPTESKTGSIPADIHIDT